MTRRFIFSTAFSGSVATFLENWETRLRKRYERIIGQRGEGGEAGTEWKVENGGYLGEDQENFPLTQMSDKGFRRLHRRWDRFRCRGWSANPIRSCRARALTLAVQLALRNARQKYPSVRKASR